MSLNPTIPKIRQTNSAIQKQLANEMKTQMEKLFQGLNRLKRMLIDFIFDNSKSIFSLLTLIMNLFLTNVL